MANVLVEEQYLQDIADSIRAKNGTNNTYTPAQMATAVSSLSIGGNTEAPYMENNNLIIPNGFTSIWIQEIKEGSSYKRIQIT